MYLAEMKNQSQIRCEIYNILLNASMIPNNFI